jgi:HK97 family phage portal protein
LKIRLFGKEIEIRAQTLGSFPRLQRDDEWAAYLTGKGYAVNHSTALKVAVVIRCADVVAKTMASLGCHLYKETEGGKARAKNKPLYKLLRHLPNKETTAYEFWHMYIFNLMLTKGAFAKIVRDQNGFISELWNIPTKCVRLDRNKETNERYIQVYYPDGGGETIYEGNFMYTPGLRFQDSDNPEDFIRIAADVLGLTMALNGYAKDFFENGANLGGFVEYPTSVSVANFERFRNDWQKTYAGVTEQHKWAVLEGGFKLTKFDTDPEAAQALESRKFEIIETCRIMGVTPHKVFQLEGVNYNSIEQLNIEFWQETIDPMDERICQTIYKDLLNTTEQNRYFARFNTNKLLKGDTKARTEYYTSMRQNGVFSANDILDLEDKNLISKEDGGDERLVNGNMIPLKYAKENKPKAMQKGDGSNGQGNKDTGDGN